MKKYFLIVLLFCLFLLGCNPPAAKPDGSISNQSAIQTIDYDNYWQYLKTSDGKSLKEVKLNDDFDGQRFDRDQYLRVCGGLLPQYYVLVDENDQTVASQEKLMQVMEKIKTPEEAVAYLYSSNCGLLKQFNSEIQFVNKTENGYLVSAIYYNWFGCGIHAHARKEFSVQETGEIKALKQTKLEFGKEFCGD